MSFRVDGLQRSSSTASARLWPEGHLSLGATEFDPNYEVSIFLVEYSGPGRYELSDSATGTTAYRPGEAEDFSSNAPGGSGFVQVEQIGQCWVADIRDPFTGLHVTRRFCTLAGEFTFHARDSLGASVDVTGTFRITAEER